MIINEKMMALRNSCHDLDSLSLLRFAIKTAFPDRIALVSSFGIESAVLLKMVASIKPDIPVIFLDTGKLFPETLAYKDALVKRFELSDVRTCSPDHTRLSRADPDGYLWHENPDLCCFVRKVEPLARALEGFDAWITGRKRFHGGMRSDLPVFEQMDGRVKINPLALWTPQQINDAFEKSEMPKHPLAEQGYTSVGCLPCTSIPACSNLPRSGRWKNHEKQECGIHLPHHVRISS